MIQNIINLIRTIQI